MLVPESVFAFLESYTHYLIVGHIDPDGDCLCSQVALKLFLEQCGKSASLYSPGPFSRPEIQHYASLFCSDVPQPASNEALVVLDCSTPERIGDFARLLTKTPSLIIDHHSSGKSFGSERWIDPAVPAVTLMIQSLFAQKKLDISEETAEYLLLGLATDTGFFRHLENNGSWVLKAAADLITGSVTPKSTYRIMYGNRPIESRLLLGRILSRIKTTFDGQLLWSYETLEDKKELGEEARDSDLLYGILSGTRNTEAFFIIREEAPRQLTVGLRSLQKIDVGKIAGDFGGGGHRNAAGFSSNLEREELEKKLLDCFRSIFCC